MVGHSSVTTTICNYIHLTHYWRWLSLEGELRAMKSLDSPIRNLVSMEKSQFSRKKHKSGLSAAYVVLGDLISADEKTELLKMEGTTFPDLALSDIRPNTLLGQFETIKHIERSLRVLEYMSSQTESAKIDLNSESSAYVIEKSDAEIAFIEEVWKAYQKILVKNVSYRAFSISAISYGIELPSAYRPKAAESYLSKSEFWDCCSALLSLPDTFLERLICLWETAWDATDRVCKVPVDEQQEWLTILATLSWQPCFSENSQPRLVNRSARLQCHELREVRTARDTEVSMLQFSHGLFLIILMREIAE